MRLAILRTGQTNAAIRASFPDYPDLYENLLNNGASRIKGAFSFRYFAVFNGEMPADPDEFDGYIITGSAAGVYEDHDWLKPLFAFIEKCDALKKRDISEKEVVSASRYRLWLGSTTPTRLHSLCAFIAWACRAPISPAPSTKSCFTLLLLFARGQIRNRPIPAVPICWFCRWQRLKTSNKFPAPFLSQNTRRLK